MQSDDSHRLRVQPTDSPPIAAAKTLLSALVANHRMYMTDAAETSTINLVAEHFARFPTRPKRLRSFLDT